MQMRVDTLRSALELLQPIIPKKTTLPVTTNVLLGDGKAVACDLEKCGIVALPEATQPCLLPHRAVMELLKAIPGSDDLTLKYEDKQIHFAWSDGAASYDAGDPKDFPPIPSFDVKAEGELDGDMLVGSFAEISRYCATEQSRPVLTAVATYLFPDKIALAGGDGFRMAYRELGLSFPQERIILVPSDTVDALQHLWKKSPSMPSPSGEGPMSYIMGKRKLSLSVDGDKAAFAFGKVRLIVKLIDGHPPEFKNLIPTPVNRVKVMAPDFDRALRRISHIAAGNTGITRLQWADAKLTVSAVAAEAGSIEVTLPAVTDDGPGRIAINIGYLSDYASGKEDYFTMGISSEKGPVLFKYRKSPDVVIMPMFVQW